MPSITFDCVFLQDRSGHTITCYKKSFLSHYICLRSSYMFVRRRQRDVRPGSPSRIDCQLQRCNRPVGATNSATPLRWNMKFSFLLLHDAVQFCVWFFFIVLFLFLLIGLFICFVGKIYGIFYYDNSLQIISEKQLLNKSSFHHKRFLTKINQSVNLTYNKRNFPL